MNKNQISPQGLLVEVGEEVRKHRWDNRITLPELAETAGVSTVLLSALEKNALENIGLNKLIDVANAVGLKVEIKLSKFPVKVPRKASSILGKTSAK